MEFTIMEDTKGRKTERIFGLSMKKTTRARDEEMPVGFCLNTEAVNRKGCLCDSYTHPLLDARVRKFGAEGKA